MNLSRIVVAIATFVILVNSVSAIEPWADEKLPVTRGLTLWLDASRENSARSAKLPFIGNNMPVDIWHDASGNKRDVQQPTPAFRPKLVQTPSGFAVHFDGKDDFLAATGVLDSFPYATIFIRALPDSNSGNMRAMLALNASGKNDYDTGLNIDFGAKKSDRLDSLNVEGVGFTGINNFITYPAALQQIHTFTISVEDPESGVHVWLDTIAQGARKRTAANIAGDEITIGARRFSNEKEPPYIQGFFDGGIAEILVYTNILNADDRALVEKYLAGKYVANESADRKLTMISTVTNPPPVQMLIPGFSVRELPLTLSNINCIKYRDDGKAVALGYDGNIWLLEDSNGDGLEDKAIPFWHKPAITAPIGMALTPANYAKGEGAFVAGKGKISLIVDTNHDDVADQEIIIAQGWKGIWHGVDSLGAAVDKEGNVFFGLGTANYTDAYLIDKETGKSQYDLKNDRGTILKVSPDFSHREIVCTGIRFPVAMAFNKDGDLFCTDQEGATWLPNGNPFDELLFIESGKHYGFPPRHPKHLPNVIDEPSVFDYSPQHQSTCGLNFNEPVNGGPTFGPKWWNGDAIVTGYSRGKLWRTKLLKSKAGYVGETQLIACLNMLTVDACITPAGGLLVACHSGLPDWGSGPNGEGKLYKIFYSDTSVPQPVLVWAASETETRIEFDRSLDGSQLKEITKQIRVVQGRSVAAGDQFEVLRPGYQVVINQLAEPRYELKVFSTALESDGRTLSIRTAPRAHAVRYAITLPDLNSGRDVSGGKLRQVSSTDLGYDLTGTETTWRSGDGTETWTGWLPHPDLNVSRAFTTGSETHDHLWRTMKSSGRLSLRTQLDLWQMLRSATQPGSKLDFQYPSETVTVVFNGTGPIQVQAPNAKVDVITERNVHVTLTPKKDALLPIEISMETRTDVQPSLDVAWFTAEDKRTRALPLRRILVPFATPQDTDSKQQMERVIPEVAGGNWLHGKRLFFGEQLGCSKCHTVGGEGGKVGPDLSNLIHRDYASVLKDIRQPSAAINPDHVAYNVELKDGESLSGVLGNGTGDEVVLTDVSGKPTTIPRSKIGSMKPSPISLMPEGLIDRLPSQEQKDLFTFLLTAPPLTPAAFPSPLLGNEPPAPRKRSTIESLLKPRVLNSALNAKPLRIVLCAAEKDPGHGAPGFHDYPIWRERWTKLLSIADNVEAQTADRWPTAEQFAKADVICLYHDNPAWTADKAAQLDEFLKRGGGLVFIHWSVNGRETVEPLAARLGRAWGFGSRFRFGPEDLKIAPHELTSGFDDLKLTDETYWNMRPDAQTERLTQTLATCVEEGQPQPQVWIREVGKGRIFVSIPGHFTWTFDDPLFRVLLLRGIAWTAHEPVDRFLELATIGARIAD